LNKITKENSSFSKVITETQLNHSLLSIDMADRANFQEQAGLVIQILNIANADGPIDDPDDVPNVRSGGGSNGSSNNSNYDGSTRPPLTPDHQVPRPQPAHETLEQVAPAESVTPVPQPYTPTNPTQGGYWHPSNNNQN
jgi:hypothetical protein